jgi:hypothetical protein
MLRLITYILFATSLSVQAFASECVPKPLPQRALALIKPLMVLRTQQAKDNFTDDGRWITESPVTPKVEKRFEALLANRSAAGDEALAYLLNVYMGEHPGEELVCEVINRGKRMVPLIRAYHECTPLIGLEPLHKFVRGSGYLPNMALDSIKSGNGCSHEE